MAFIQKHKLAWEGLLMVAGTTVLAFAINVFFSPADLIMGGFSGLAIIIRSLVRSLYGRELPIWLLNAVLNVPLFIAGLRMFGIKRLGKTLFATVWLSFALLYTEPLAGVFQMGGDLFLVAVIGGAISGTGLGLVFRCMATTGGTDLLGAVANHMNKRISSARYMMIFDWIVITAGIFVFGLEKSLYAVIATYLCAKICDSILDGLSFAKAAFIISDKADEIAEKLMAGLDRGVSGLHAKGMYTNDEKNILLSVVANKEILELKRIVGSADPGAFIIVTDVREVLGSGFKDFE